MSFDYELVDAWKKDEYNLGVSEEGKLVAAAALTHSRCLTNLLGTSTFLIDRFHIFPAYRGSAAQEIILEKVLADFSERGESIAVSLEKGDPLADLCLRKGFREKEGFLYWSPRRGK